MLSKKIKIARVEAGLTQQELAEKLGKTAQTVISWENGTFSPRSKVIEQLAKITQKPLSFFLDGERESVNQQATINSGNMTQNISSNSNDINRQLEIINLKLDLLLEKIDKKG